MKCSLSDNAIKALQKVVFSKLKRLASEEQDLDVKGLTQEIYDLIFEQTQDHATALDASRFVPVFLNQAKGLDVGMAKYFVESGVDANELDRNIIAFTNEDSGLNAVESYLGLAEPSNLAGDVNTLNGVGVQGSLDFPTEDPGATKTPTSDKPNATQNQRAQSDRPYMVFDGAPTAFADRDREIIDYDTLEINEEEAFYFKVKRNLIDAIIQAGGDSVVMDYKGFGPVYLMAIRMDEIPPGDLKPEQLRFLQENPEAAKQGVGLVLTNQFGEFLTFDPQTGEPTLDDNGKVAYYRMFNPENRGNIDAHARLLAEERGLSKAAAKQIIEKELKTVSDIREYVLDGNTFMFNITGGSVGVITESSQNRQPLSTYNFGNNALNLEVIKTGEEEPGFRRGTGYFKVPESHNNKITIERPRIANEGNVSIDTLTSLIVDDLIDEFGNKLAPSDKRQLIDQYIYKNDTRLQYKIETIPGEQTADGLPEVKTFVLLDGDRYNLDTAEEKEVARQALTEYFTELRPDVTKAESELTPAQLKNMLGANAPRSSWKINSAIPIIEENEEGERVHATNADGEKLYKIVDNVKLHLNKDLMGANIQEVSIEEVTDPDGTTRKIISTESKPYSDFVKENFMIHARLNNENKVATTSAYFMFEPMQQDLDDLYDEVEVSTEPSEEVKNVPEDTTLQEGPSGQSVMDQAINMARNNPDYLSKNTITKNADVEATEKQIKEAKNWYDNLKWETTDADGKKRTVYFKDLVPFNDMMHMVNSQDPNSIATWAMHGITLWDGADYSDLYHEAWHAFTQAFLTIEQKQKLYGELRQKSGSFTTYKGKQVTFKSATNLELEEYLAEDFRKYMLNGGRAKKNSPERNGFFKKLVQILEMLFGNLTMASINANERADKTINDLYENLKLGNLTQYSFNSQNVMFGSLNAGVRAFDPKEVRAEINISNSKLLTDSLDSLLFEFTDRLNSQLSDQEFAEYIEAQKTFNDSQSTLEEKKKAKAIIEAAEDKKTYKYSSSILRNKQTLTMAYMYAKERLKGIRENKNKELEALKATPESIEANESKIKELENQVQLLAWAERNFGDLENITNNVPDEEGNIKGLIAYHQSKSEKFYSDLNFFEVLEDEEMDEDSTFLKGREGYGSDSANAHSLNELGRKEVLYLIKGLNSVKEGKAQINEFGIPELVDYSTAFNMIAKTLENTLNPEVMEAKMQESDYEPIQQLLSRLGPLNSQDPKSVRLWNQFWQTFNKSRIRLYMVSIEGQEVDGKRSTLSKVHEAFNDVSKIQRQWDSGFRITPAETSKYIKRDEKGNYLDIDAFITDFGNINNPNQRDKYDPSKNYDALKALGIDISDNILMVQYVNENKLAAAFINHLWKIKEYNKTFAGPNKRVVRKPSDIVKAINQTTKGGATFRGISSSAGRLKTLAEVHAKFSETVSNYKVTNAEGNSQYEHSLNNTLSVLTNAINDANTYRELIEMPHMSHLAEDDFAKATTLLNSVFILDVDPGNPSYGTKRQVKGKAVNLNLYNVAGLRYTEKGDEAEFEDGIASASADPFTKLIMDLHLVTQIGYPELMRHADKATSFGINVDKIIRKVGKSKSGIDRMFINMEDFTGQNYHKVAYSMIRPHIIAELKRIKKFRVLQDLYNEADKIEDEEQRRAAYEEIGVMDHDYLERGQNFVAFDDVLDEQTQKDLIDAIATVDDVEAFFIDSQIGLDLNVAMFNDVQSYFEAQLEEVRDLFKESDFISSSLMQSTMTSLGLSTAQEAKDIILKSFVYNSWINNLDTLHLIYGDLAQYNEQKQEFHKRNAGFGSTGEMHRSDKTYQDYVNNVLKRSYGESLGYASRSYDGTLHTAVVEDSVQNSEYIDELRERLGEAAKTYLRMEEGDGQGWITFDMYRILKDSQGDWTDAQERLYQDISKGIYVDPSLVAEFFPPLKSQYQGPMQTKNAAVNGNLIAMHKFSLVPLIPTVIEGTNLEVFHKKMMREQIDYALFGTGSKVLTFTTTKEKDPFYKKGTRTIADDQPFTKNIIYINYLKDQLRIAPKFKGKTIFSTQLRKLIEDGLYEQGAALNNEFKEKVEAYEQHLKELTELHKEQLLREMNWEEVDGELKGDLKDLLKFVKKELSRRDLAEHEIDFIQINRHGYPKIDLSVSLSSEQIEKVLNSIVTNRLVKQTTKGEGLIQVSGAGFEKATAEDLEKYDATNDLPFYEYGKGKDGKTTAMKVKIALQGDFLKLLELTDLEGNVIGTRERLNELLRDEAWLDADNNRQMVTMTAVRIPVQGTNSMEFMEVFEFLPTEAGNILIPPSEIVAKSGSDFDIDKLTVMMPNIGKKVKKAKLTNGFLRDMQEAFPDLDFSRDNVNIVLDAAKSAETMQFLDENDRQILDILEENAETEIFYHTGKTIKGMQNALIEDIRGILEMPLIFNALVTPNGTEILEELVEDLRDDVRDYDEFNTVRGEARTFEKDGKEKRKISGTRVFEIRYNLYKHMSNNIGKQTLGLGAVDNTYNTLFNRVGFRMNPTAGISTKEYNRLIEKRKELESRNKKLGPEDTKKLAQYHRQTLFMDHNMIDVDGEQAISLSNIMDAENKYRISDVINQMINGWVDIAKDAWIFDIQGNKLVSPTLLFLVQAGVPVKQAVYFASMPMVREYVKLQQKANSTLGRAFDAQHPKGKNFYRMQARSEILSNPRFGFNVDPAKLEVKKQNGTINKVAVEVTDDFFSGRTDKKFKADELRRGIKDYADSQRDDVEYEFTDLDRAAFIHFLEAENMAKAVRDVKLNLNVDTSKSGSLFEAQNKIIMIEKLKGESRIPSEMIDKILEDSPIASFLIQDFQIEIWKDLFTLRNHPAINNHIIDIIKNNKSLIESTFGDEEMFANEYKNDLVNFIFQNAVKTFDINSKKYRGRKIEASVPPSVKQVQEVDLLQQGAFVYNDVLYVDKVTLRNQYLNKAWSKRSYVEQRGLANMPASTFTTPDEYYNFVYEREYLRSTRPYEEVKDTKEFKHVLKSVKQDKKLLGLIGIQSAVPKLTEKEKISRHAYEVYLKNEALKTVYNSHNMFNGPNSFANEFQLLMHDFGDLKKEFPLLRHLSSDEHPNGTINLKLDDNFLDSFTIDTFHENLRDLASGNIAMSLDKEDYKRITNFFQRFPMVAFLQSGMNTRSSLSMIRIVPQDVLVRTIEKPLKDFVDHLNYYSESVVAEGEDYLMPLLLEYDRLFKKNNQSIRLSVRGKNYSTWMSPQISREILEAQKELTYGDQKVSKDDYSRAARDKALELREESFGTAFRTRKLLNSDVETFDPLDVRTTNRAKEIAEENPDKVFVYNLATENTNNATSGDHVFHETGMPNVFGLPTRLSYSGGIQGLFHDVNGEANPEAVALIDEAIEQLKYMRDVEGKELVFSDSGYGIEMVGGEYTRFTTIPKEQGESDDEYTARVKKKWENKVPKSHLYKQVNKNARGEVTGIAWKILSPAGSVKDKMIGRQTFAYLSKQLVENFGYINRDFDRIPLGRATIQETAGQPITDQMVRDLMNNCLT